MKVDRVQNNLEDGFLGKIPKEHAVFLFKAENATTEDELISVLTTIRNWDNLGDQADLRAWVEILDRIDVILTRLTESESLVLISSKAKGSEVESDETIEKRRKVVVDSKDDDKNLQDAKAVLNFLLVLLRNSRGRQVFNSVDQLVALLAARDPHLEMMVIQTINALLLPPTLYRHAEDESHGKTQAQGHEVLQERLLVLAQGWGTKANNLGIKSCLCEATTDLPVLGNNLYFEFNRLDADGDSSENQLEQQVLRGSGLVTVEIPNVSSKLYARNPHEEDFGGRALANEFLDLVKEYKIPVKHQFALLKRLQLANDFANKEGRTKRIKVRLLAISSFFLCSTEEADAAMAYLANEPDIAFELTELIQPNLADEKNTANIPVEISILALVSLEALATDNESGAPGVIGDTAGILRALGAMKGSVNGILASVMRTAIAYAQSDWKMVSSSENDDSDPIMSQDPGLEVGMQFAQMTSMDANDRSTSGEKNLMKAIDFEYQESCAKWSEAVLSLATAVIVTSQGAAAIAESGMVQTLVQLLVSVEERFKSPEGLEKLVHRESWIHVLSLSCYVLDTIMSIHNSSAAVFGRLGGASSIISLMDLLFGIAISKSASDTEFAKLPGVSFEIKTDTSVSTSSTSSDRPVFKEHTAVKCVSENSLTASELALMHVLFNTMIAYHHASSQTGFWASVEQDFTSDTSKLGLSMIRVFDNCEAMGDTLFHLVTLLLSNMMNSNPTMVRQIISNGIASSVLNVVTSDRLPPETNCISLIPQILDAICLNNVGQERVLASKPFDFLFHVLTSEKYVQAVMQCFVEELNLGVTVEEFLRHFPDLREPFAASCVAALEKLVRLGREAGENVVYSDVEQKEPLLLRRFIFHTVTLIHHAAETEETCSELAKRGVPSLLLQLYPHSLPNSHYFLVDRARKLGENQLAAKEAKASKKRVSAPKVPSYRGAGVISMTLSAWHNVEAKSYWDVLLDALTKQLNHVGMSRLGLALDTDPPVKIAPETKEKLYVEDDKVLSAMLSMKPVVIPMIPKADEKLTHQERHDQVQRVADQTSEVMGSRPLPIAKAAMYTRQVVLMEWLMTMILDFLNSSSSWSTSTRDEIVFHIPSDRVLDIVLTIGRFQHELRQQVSIANVKYLELHGKAIEKEEEDPEENTLQNAISTELSRFNALFVPFVQQLVRSIFIKPSRLWEEDAMRRGVALAQCVCDIIKATLPEEQEGKCSPEEIALRGQIIGSICEFLWDSKRRDVNQILWAILYKDDMFTRLFRVCRTVLQEAIKGSPSTSRTLARASLASITRFLRLVLKRNSGEDAEKYKEMLLEKAFEDLEDTGLLKGKDMVLDVQYKLLEVLTPVILEPSMGGLPPLGSQLILGVVLRAINFNKNKPESPSRITERTWEGDNNEEEDAEEEFQPNPEVASQISAMGFPIALVRRAQRATDSNDSQVITTWLLEYANDEVDSGEEDENEEANGPSDVHMDGAASSNQEAKEGDNAEMHQEEEVSTSEDTGVPQRPSEEYIKMVKRQTMIKSFNSAALKYVLGVLGGSHDRNSSGFGLVPVDEDVQTGRIVAFGKESETSEERNRLRIKQTIDLAAAVLIQLDKNYVDVGTVLKELIQALRASANDEELLKPQTATTFGSTMRCFCLYVLHTVPSGELYESYLMGLELAFDAFKLLERSESPLMFANAPADSSVKEVSIWPDWVYPCLLAFDFSLTLVCHQLDYGSGEATVPEFNDGNDDKGALSEEDQAVSDARSAFKESMKEAKKGEALLEPLGAFFTRTRRSKLLEFCNLFLTQVQPTKDVLHGTLLVVSQLIKDYSLGALFKSEGGVGTLLRLSSSSNFPGLHGLIELIISRVMDVQRDVQVGMKESIRAMYSRVSKLSRRSAPVMLENFVASCRPLALRDFCLFCKCLEEVVCIKAYPSGLPAPKIQVLGEGTHPRVIVTLRDEKAQNSKSEKNENDTTTLVADAIAAAMSKHGNTKGNSQNASGLSATLKFSAFEPIVLSIVETFVQGLSSIENGEKTLLSPSESLRILKDIITLFPSCLACLLKPTSEEFALRYKKALKKVKIHSVVHDLCDSSFAGFLIGHVIGPAHALPLPEGKTSKDVAKERVALSKIARNLIVFMASRFAKSEISEPIVLLLGAAFHNLNRWCRTDDEYNTSAGIGQAADAYQAWSDLALHLLAPRKKGSSSKSAMSWEVARLMMENDFVPLFAEALELLNLSHPKAPHAACNVLRPLEVLTRLDVVQHLRKLIARQQRGTKGYQTPGAKSTAATPMANRRPAHDDGAPTPSVIVDHAAVDDNDTAATRAWNRFQEGVDQMMEEEEGEETSSSEEENSDDEMEEDDNLVNIEIVEEDEEEEEDDMEEVEEDDVDVDDDLFLHNSEDRERLREQYLVMSEESEDESSGPSDDEDSAEESSDGESSGPSEEEFVQIDMESDDGEGPRVVNAIPGMQGFTIPRGQDGPTNFEQFFQSILGQGASNLFGGGRGRMNMVDLALPGSRLGRRLEDEARQTLGWVPLGNSGAVASTLQTIPASLPLPGSRSIPPSVRNPPSLAQDLSHFGVFDVNWLNPGSVLVPDGVLVPRTSVSNNNNPRESFHPLMEELVPNTSNPSSARSRRRAASPTQAIMSASPVSMGLLVNLEAGLGGQRNNRPPTRRTGNNGSSQHGDEGVELEYANELGRATLESEIDESIMADLVFSIVGLTVEEPSTKEEAKEEKEQEDVNQKAEETGEGQDQEMVNTSTTAGSATEAVAETSTNESNQEGSQGDNATVASGEDTANNPTEENTLDSNVAESNTETQVDSATGVPAAAESLPEPPSQTSSVNEANSNAEGEVSEDDEAALVRAIQMSMEVAAELGADANETTESNEADDAPESSSTVQDTSDSAQSEEKQANGDGEGANEAAQSQEPSETEANTGEENPEQSGAGIPVPAGVDPDVWASLPLEMQHEYLVEQGLPIPSPGTSSADNGGNATAAEGVSAPEVDEQAAFLAAMPEDIRAEILAQQERERAAASAPDPEPIDPSNAEDMDNASFIASIADPELRAEIFLTSGPSIIRSLPPHLRAEAELVLQRHGYRSRMEARSNRNNQANENKEEEDKYKNPTIKLPHELRGSALLNQRGIRAILRLLFLSNVPRKQVLNAVLWNLSQNPATRSMLVEHLMQLLVFKVDKDAGHSAETPGKSLAGAFKFLRKGRKGKQSETKAQQLDKVKWPPRHLEVAGERDGTYLPTTMIRSSVNRNKLVGEYIAPPPTVSLRIMETLNKLYENTRVLVLFLQSKEQANEGSKSPKLTTPKSPRTPRQSSTSSRTGSSVLANFPDGGLEAVLTMLALQEYKLSSLHLDGIILLLSKVVEPMKDLKVRPEEDSQSQIVDQDVKEESEDSKANSDDKLNPEKVEQQQQESKQKSKDAEELFVVPARVVAPDQLRYLAEVLLMDQCSESTFNKATTVVNALANVPSNRDVLLRELLVTAEALGRRTVSDLDALAKMMRNAMFTDGHKANFMFTSNTETKLLRILKTVNGLVDSSGALRDLCQAVDLDLLWAALSRCLAIVAELSASEDDESSRPGASTGRAPGASVDNTEEEDEEEEESDDGTDTDSAHNNTVALNLLTSSQPKSATLSSSLSRFLPMIEAFFIMNSFSDADLKRSETSDAKIHEETKSVATGTSSVEDSSTSRLLSFVQDNQKILNILVRQTPSLLDNSLSCLVKHPKCRSVLAFDNKRLYFTVAMKRLRTDARRAVYGNPTVRLTVRREYVFEDSFHQLMLRDSDELRGKLSVVFQGEEGIDAGGVTREWYSILARETFKPGYALFKPSADSSAFQPDPRSHIDDNHLKYFKFVGRVVGKAIADGHLLDAHFTRSFYKHILGIPVTYHDIQSVDPQIYNSLMQLLQYNIDELGLELNFTMTVEEFGVHKTVELKPNGAHIAVTEQNKLEYVKLATKHRMTTGIRDQIDSFLEGFSELVPRELIQMFNEQELELLISGVPTIDLDDLKANTEYTNYSLASPQVRWFWNTIDSLDTSDHARFLMFVTGTSKVPLEGFKGLVGMRGLQRFSIHKAYGGDKALPTAHTCFNQLDLPEYSTEEILREKLVYAIKEGGEGFGFG